MKTIIYNYMDAVVDSSRIKKRVTALTHLGVVGLFLRRDIIKKQPQL